MELGNYSLSLTVKDIKVSQAFYEKLGFEAIKGNSDENWLIMRNGETIIGLFQGMFEKNMLTFNPGWNSNEEEVNPFLDIRQIQEKLIKEGIEVINKIDEKTEGPASFLIVDPDGNPILFDQHR